MTQIVIPQIKNLQQTLENLKCNTWTVGESYLKHTLVAYPNAGNVALYRVIKDGYTASDLGADILAGFLERVEAPEPLVYNNSEPTPIAIGGISEGTTFVNKTMQEMWDALLYPELYPTLVSPSALFSLSITGLREVGEIVPSIIATASFNRGLISPQYYSASPYRSGLPHTYVYTGAGLPASVASTALSDTQTISNYVVTLGTQQWSSSVAYDEGVQPKTSKNNNYDTPLPAGTTPSIVQTITGVYPLFGTTVSITTLTKQALMYHNSSYFQFNMVAETGPNKQVAAFSIAHAPITGIQFYNTISGQWEWLGGTKANSLTHFTISTEDKDINGNIVSYKIYTHNQSLIGSRQLRFYTT